MGRRRLRIAVAGAAALSVVAACTAFSATPGAAESAEAGAPDGASDVPTGGDASPDDADAGPPVTTVTNASLCADAGTDAHCYEDEFGEPTLGSMGWKMGSQNGYEAGVAELNPAAAGDRSPPALHVVLLSPATPGQASYFIRRTFPDMTSTGLVVAFDLAVNALAFDDSKTPVDSLVISVDGAGYAAQLNVTKNSKNVLSFDIAEAATGGGFVPHDYFVTGPQVLLDEWHHYALALDCAHGTIQLWIDGFEAGLSTASSFLLPKGLVQIAVDLGAQTDNPNESIDLEYDNLRVEIEE